MAGRVARLPDSPSRRSLANVIEELSERARGVRARPRIAALHTAVSTLLSAPP